MPTPLRTQIKQAILTLVTGTVFPAAVNGQTTWISTSRRLKLFNAVDPSAQPALFLCQHSEGYQSRGASLPPRRWLEVGLWCYASTAGDGVVGDDLLDSMEEGLEAVLAPDDPIRNELTLGGLVYWAKIDRQNPLFIRDPGDIDGQALLVLPIRVLLP